MNNCYGLYLLNLSIWWCHTFIHMHVILSVKFDLTCPFLSLVCDLICLMMSFFICFLSVRNLSKRSLNAGAPVFYIFIWCICPENYFNKIALARMMPLVSFILNYVEEGWLWFWVNLHTFFWYMYHTVHGVLHLLSYYYTLFLCVY